MELIARRVQMLILMDLGLTLTLTLTLTGISEDLPQGISKK